jgi:hypothetical protein
MQIMESLGGDNAWIDRFVAQHASLAYFWGVMLMYALSPKHAYQFSELVEGHAVDTYEGTHPQAMPIFLCVAVCIGTTATAHLVFATCGCLGAPAVLTSCDMRPDCVPIDFLQQHLLLSFHLTGTDGTTGGNVATDWSASHVTRGAIGAIDIAGMLGKAHGAGCIYIGQVCAHAVFAEQNKDILAALPPPTVAAEYYLGSDIYMFQSFLVSEGAKCRAPKCESLLDVFHNVIDDEIEHKKTMIACQSPTEVARQLAAAKDEKCDV